MSQQLEATDGDTVASNANDNVVRPLGAIECAMAVSHHEALGSTQSTLVVHLVGKVSFEGLQRGVRKAFARYRLLRCAIAKVEDTYHFIDRNDFSAISIQKNRLDLDRWDEQESDELHRALNEDDSVWRVALYSDTSAVIHRLVIVFHHAIVDSAGAKAVLQILLHSAASHPNDGFIDDSSADEANFDVPPAIDAFLGTPASNASSGPVSATPAPISHRHTEPVASRRTAYARSRIPPALLTSINRCCKADKITLDAAIAAAFAMSCVQAQIGGPSVCVKTAVSLREYANTKGGPLEGLACYIGVSDVVLEMTSGDLVPSAQEYHRKLLLQTIGYLTKKSTVRLDNLEQGIRALRDSNHFNCVGITNVGELLDQNDFGQFKVVDIYNLTNRVLGGPAVVLQLARTADEMQLIYMYAKPLISEDTIGAVRNQFLSSLAAYCEQHEKDALAEAAP